LAKITVEICDKHKNDCDITASMPSQNMGPM